MGRGVIWHNGNKGLALVTRSGSHTLFKAILEEFYPQNNQSEQVLVHEHDRWHPVMNLSDIHDLSMFEITNLEYAVMVRDPIERFRSSCARVGCTVGEGLGMHNENVHFWSMKSMGILESPNVKYFKFPEQISQCAIYLGLTNPVSHLNQENIDKKPILNQTDIIQIQQYYAEDLMIYNNL
jgi:hypothetical protein